MSLVGASLWSNARLRTINQRLAGGDRPGRSPCAQGAGAGRDCRSGTRWAHSFDWPPRHSTPPSPSGPRRSSAISRSMPAARPRARSSGATSGAGPAAMSSSCSAPPPRSSGWRLSPDGKVLATSDHTAGVQIRDAASGSLIRGTEQGIGKIGAPVISPDGALIATEDRDRESESPDAFSIWEVASGRRKVRLSMGQGHDFLGCQFLPDGSFLGFANPLLTRLWNVADDPSRPKLLGEFTTNAATDSAATGGSFITLENAPYSPSA